MKRLLTFETFVPKQVATRLLKAKERGMFVYDKDQNFELVDGQTVGFGMVYVTYKAGNYVWYAWLGDRLKKYGTDDIDMAVIVREDLSAVDIKYRLNSFVPDPELKQFTTTKWPLELEQLVHRMSLQLIDDLYVNGALEMDMSGPELYSLAKPLEPKILAAIEKLKPAA